MNVQEVKLLARLTADIDDEYLAALLPLLKEAVRTYCRKDFMTEAGTEDFPALVKMALVKWVQLFSIPAGVSSQGLGSATFSYDAADVSSIPKPVKNLLDDYLSSIEGEQTSIFDFIPQKPRERPRFKTPGKDVWDSWGGWGGGA